MSEFINVTEVEKLPINKVDSLVAIDANNHIRRTSITVDQVLDEDSTNPISSKGVRDALEELRGEIDVNIEDVNSEIQSLDEDIDDVRDEIVILNKELEDYATKDWVGREINDAIQGGVDLTGYATESWVEGKGYITEDELNAKNYLTSIPSEYVTESELTTKGYATESYVSGLIGDINSVLDQINGEVV